MFVAPKNPPAKFAKGHTNTKEKIRKEFMLHKAGGGKGRNLTMCQRILEAIPPTSIQAEQDFSVVKAVIGEHRANLSSTTLDSIFTLRKAFEYGI